MTKETLFESLQYLDDDLIVVGKTKAKQKQAWQRWGCAAACLVLLAGTALFAFPAPSGGSPTSGETENAVQTARPDRSGDTVPEEAPSAAVNDPAPATLVWIEEDGSTAQADWSLKQGFALVGDQLNAEQREACLPETLPPQMEQAEGSAIYLLGDGSGGLVYVELKLTNPAWGGVSTVQIRDRNAWQIPVCGMERNEDGRIDVIQGQEYRACRHTYYRGEGDPEENPPQPWVELRVRFEKEALDYTLLANAPVTEEANAACDLRDLLLAYAESPSVPDLSSFRCGDYVHRDEALRFAEARSDPEFGAYLPQTEPEGFDEASIRRYRLGAVGEASTEDWLSADWYWSGERRHLLWRIRPAEEDAMLRLVSLEEPERYDFSRYPATNWYYAIAPENRLAMENPTFRAEDLTLALVQARAHEDDEGSTLLRFSVLFRSGVLVSVDSCGLAPEWIFAQLSSIGA